MKLKRIFHNSALFNRHRDSDRDRGNNKWTLFLKWISAHCSIKHFITIHWKVSSPLNNNNKNNVSNFYETQVLYSKISQSIHLITTNWKTDSDEWKQIENDWEWLPLMEWRCCGTLIVHIDNFINALLWVFQLNRNVDVIDK